MSSHFTLQHGRTHSPVLEPACACPLCGKSDRVIKAAAINLIQPPLPPEQKLYRPPVLYEDPLRRYWSKFIVLSCLAGVMGFLAGHPFFDAIAKSTLEGMVYPFVIPSILVASPLLFIVIILADTYFIEIPRLNRQFLDDWMVFIANMQRAQTEYQEKLQDWENVMRLWGETYYCQRHHCVFTPTSGKSAPAEQAADFLYQMIG